MRASAPGPDGLSYSAWKAGPPVCRQVLYDCYVDWLATGELPAGFNHAFLALLPKVDSPSLAPHETRPLSLANTDSNIFATMLRLTLEPKVHAVLSHVLAGFAQVLDFGVRAPGCQRACAAGRRPFFDFEAAFPTLDHEYLWSVLRESGMPRHILLAVQSLYGQYWHWLKW